MQNGAICARWKTGSHAGAKVPCCYHRAVAYAEKKTFCDSIDSPVEKSSLSSFSSCSFWSRHRIGKDHISQPKWSVAVAAGAPAPWKGEAPAVRTCERCFRQTRSEKRIQWCAESTSLVSKRADITKSEDLNPPRRGVVLCFPLLPVLRLLEHGTHKRPRMDGAGPTTALPQPLVSNHNNAGLEDRKRVSSQKGTKAKGTDSQASLMRSLQDMVPLPQLQTLPPARAA